MSQPEAAPTDEPSAAWRRAAACGLTFRPIDDSDLGFLSRLYASTREPELAHVPWTAEQKAGFCDMQFRAQHAHYRKNYPTAEWLLIRRCDAPVGRLYIDRWRSEHRLVDIALVPAQRAQGLGEALLRDLIEEAAAAGKPLTIHVEKNNPAQRLYARLGFRPVGEHGVYDLLESRAAESQVKIA